MDTRNGWEYNRPVEHVAGADNIGLLLTKKTKIMKTGKQQEFSHLWEIGRVVVVVGEFKSS